MRLNLNDWEVDAREHLSSMAYGYYVSGANDEITLRDNRAAFDRIALRYRVLRDVSRRDLSTEVLGSTLSMPVAVAPTAYHQLATPEGEVTTARAVAAAGTAMGLSSLSNRAVEKVAAAADVPLWFQLYVYQDRAITEAMLDRVAAAGCQAILFTVDAPLLGRRERDLRQPFEVPPDFAMENILPIGHEGGPVGTGQNLAAYFAELLDPSIDWDDLAWLAERSAVPVLVKGVVHPDDARLAIEYGAAGVVVSNHGGRQLDTSPATIRALPDIAAALRGVQCKDGSTPTLLLDGGVRRGTDVIKAIALGADAVLLGRPILWGLATNGQAGAERILAMMRDEVDLAMALCGCRTVAEITDDLIMP